VIRQMVLLSLSAIQEGRIVGMGGDVPCVLDIDTKWR
jgi:hypothetical protein